MDGELTYLASPYTHECPLVRQVRYEAVDRAAASLVRAGIHVFSPISHCHPMALRYGLPRTWAFWAAYDRCMLSRCQRFAILTLEGWRASEGVTAETGIAGEIGLPVLLLHPADPVGIYKEVIR